MNARSCDIVPKCLSKWEGTPGTQCLHTPSLLPGYCFNGVWLMAGTFRLEKLTDRQTEIGVDFSDVFKFPRNLGSLRMYANGVVSELWSIENTALKIVI